MSEIRHQFRTVANFRSCVFAAVLLRSLELQGKRLSSTTLRDPTPV
jgi:hypothetical protein